MPEPEPTPTPTPQPPPGAPGAVGDKVNWTDPAGAPHDAVILMVNPWVTDWTIVWVTDSSSTVETIGHLSVQVPVLTQRFYPTISQYSAVPKPGCWTPMATVLPAPGVPGPTPPPLPTPTPSVSS